MRGALHTLVEPNARRLLDEVLNRSPAYVRIYMQLVAELKALPAPGRTLPSPRRLAQTLGVSTTTVRSAYAMLRQEGLIVLDDQGRWRASCDTASPTSDAVLNWVRTVATGPS